MAVSETVLLSDLTLPLGYLVKTLSHELQVSQGKGIKIWELGQHPPTCVHKPQRPGAAPRVAEAHRDGMVTAPLSPPSQKGGLPITCSPINVPEQGTSELGLDFPQIRPLLVRSVQERVPWNRWLCLWPAQCLCVWARDQNPFIKARLRLLGSEIQKIPPGLRARPCWQPSAPRCSRQAGRILPGGWCQPGHRPALISWAFFLNIWHKRSSC